MKKYNEFYNADLSIIEENCRIEEKVEQLLSFVEAETKKGALTWIEEEEFEFCTNIFDGTHSLTVGKRGSVVINVADEANKIQNCYIIYDGSTKNSPTAQSIYHFLFSQRQTSERYERLKQDKVKLSFLEQFVEKIKKRK